MGDTPSTSNTAAKTADEIIHFAIFQVALTAAETAIIAQVAFLGWPIIKNILEWVLGFIGGFIYANLADFATLQIIDFQTGSERTAYANAEAKLRQAHLSGDQNALDQATAEFKKTLASLIHFDGSATP